MLDRLTVVLAHETGHALYTADGRDAATVLDATVRNGIRDGRQFGEPYLDLTSAVEQYRLDRRQTEGYAELMALNALSSRVNQERTGSLDVPEFLKRAKANSNCVIYDDATKSHVFAEGLTLKPNGMIEGELHASGPVNAAVANCHFDGPASLGPKGVSDYNHYFGVYPIQIIADAVQENRGMSQAVPQIRLDMAKLGLTPQGLADAGLDLGGVGKGLDVVDISHGGEKHITLRQTLPSRSATQEPDSPQTAPTFVPLLSDPAHPAHDQYAQTLRAFAASPQIAAAGYSGEQLQLVAANLVAGNLKVRESRNGPPLQERIDRVDAATIASDGSHVTIIQRAAQDATSFRFGLPMEQAHAGSIEAASQLAFDGLQQQKAQELAQQPERERAPQPEPQGPSR